MRYFIILLIFLFPQKISAQGLYPPGSHVYTFKHVNNATVDCDWNFVCEQGTPLYHQLTQEQLGRLSGWARTSVYVKGQETVMFVVYVSRYGDNVPVSNAIRAWDDFRSTLANPRLGWIYKPGKEYVGSDGYFAQFTWQPHNHHQHTWAMAAVHGNIEVEGVVIADYPVIPKHELNNYLARQVRAALYAPAP